MAHASRTEPLVPSFAVQLNGRPLGTDMALWIVNVTVEDDLDVPSMFTLELISKSDERTTTPWTDDARLTLGATIEISMGYGDDRESLIIGEVTALEPVFSIAGPPTLIVRGYDKRHRLNGVRRTRGFSGRTDKTIADEICAPLHVEIASTDNGVTHEYVLQTNQTDLEFLRERAHRCRFELAMDGETLLFRPVGSAAASAVTLALSDDLLDFRPRLSLVPTTSVRVFGWDAKGKQTFTSTVNAGAEVSKMAGDQSASEQTFLALGDAQEAIVRVPVATQAEADQLAADRFNAASLDFIRAEGLARGRTDIRAGRVIHLDELGTRFSGDYYVTSAVHRFSRRDGYLTDFRVRRNAS